MARKSKRAKKKASAPVIRKNLYLVYLHGIATGLDEKEPKLEQEETDIKPTKSSYETLIQQTLQKEVSYQQTETIDKEESKNYATDFNNDIVRRLEDIAKSENYHSIYSQKPEVRRAPIEYDIKSISIEWYSNESYNNARQNYFNHFPSHYATKSRTQKRLDRFKLVTYNIIKPSGISLFVYLLALGVFTWLPWFLFTVFADSSAPTHPTKIFPYVNSIFQLEKSFISTILAMAFSTGLIFVIFVFIVIIYYALVEIYKFFSSVSQPTDYKDASSEMTRQTEAFDSDTLIGSLIVGPFVGWLLYDAIIGHKYFTWFNPNLTVWDIFILTVASILFLAAISDIVFETLPTTFSEFIIHLIGGVRAEVDPFLVEVMWYTFNTQARQNVLKHVDSCLINPDTGDSLTSDDDVIFITHSLGSVIAFDYLRKMTGHAKLTQIFDPQLLPNEISSFISDPPDSSKTTVNFNLLGLITMGSPLRLFLYTLNQNFQHEVSVQAMANQGGSKFTCSWYNLYDQRDFIGQTLWIDSTDKEFFDFGDLEIKLNTYGLRTHMEYWRDTNAKFTVATIVEHLIDIRRIEYQNDLPIAPEEETPDPLPG